MFNKNYWHFTPLGVLILVFGTILSIGSLIPGSWVGDIKLTQRDVQAKKERELARALNGLEKNLMDNQELMQNCASGCVQTLLLKTKISFLKNLYQIYKCPAQVNILTEFDSAYHIALVKNHRISNMPDMMFMQHFNNLKANPCDVE